MSKRYKYTCPDVIHYRKNQYRLVGASYVLSFLPVLFMWGAMASLNKEINEPPKTDIPVEQ